MAQQVIDAVAHVKEALERSAIADIRHLEVESDGERVLLSGIVGSFYHKQLAQELARYSVQGVEVANAISVEYRKSDDEPDWRI
jgi:osmotically-inducible protein OsmY